MSAGLRAVGQLTRVSIVSKSFSRGLRMVQPAEPVSPVPPPVQQTPSPETKSQTPNPAQTTPRAEQPARPKPTTPAPTQPQTRNYSTSLYRRFHTSTSLYAPKDASTIDHTFFPDLHPPLPENVRAVIEPWTVPLLPRDPADDRSEVYSSPNLIFAPAKERYTYISADAETSASQIPTEQGISTVADLSTHHNGGPSSLTDLLDNSAVAFDPYNISHRMGTNAKSANDTTSSQAEETPLIAVKKVWQGFVEDVVGKQAAKT